MKFILLAIFVILLSLHVMISNAQRDKISQRNGKSLSKNHGGFYQKKRGKNDRSRSSTRGRRRGYGRGRLAPLEVPDNPDECLPDEYIVVLKESSPDKSVPRLAKYLRKKGVEVKYEYNGDIFKGLALANVKPRIRLKIRRIKLVKVVTSDCQINTTDVASWGLDRIDQRNLPLDNNFSPNGTGEGTLVYVVDTGVQYDHPDFEGRAGPFFDVINDGLNANDCHGHGTHVAGIVAGSVYGVAKKAQILSVRVLGCLGSGLTSGVIAGLTEIANSGCAPAVVQMSLGGSRSTAMDLSVKALVEKNFVVVVAAGNSAISACLVSPARAPEAITVAASDIDDNRAVFSNFGSCVDIFGPGVGITSDWISSSTRTTSGTSMAAPHVSGVAAILIELHCFDILPSEVEAIILEEATPDVITDVQGSPNLLVFTEDLGLEPPATCSFNCPT